MNNLAPIILFVYNRPWHTQQTLTALKENNLSEDSILIIFSDAAKTDDERKNVSLVREYIEKINGFKELYIVKRDVNMGLAKSIVDGVSSVTEQYGKAIVLEDDIVTSPYFLTYMNTALEKYESKKDIWHINGWNYPIINDGLKDVFCWRLMNCWGWATWADRWSHFEKNIDSVIYGFTKNDIYKLNIDGTENFFGQVIANKNKKINSWAIFWYISIFKKNGLCLTPTKSLVENIGNDNSGVNCIGTDVFSSINLSQGSNDFSYETELFEEKIAIEYLKKFYKNNKATLLQRVTRKFKSLIV